MQHKERKFLVDAMLGNIAKKLRFLGYDSQYFPHIQDEKLLEILQHENRILVTKDGELSRKLEKLNLQVIFLTGNDEITHLRKIKNKSNIENFSISGDIVRCSLCNEKLDKIEKNLAIGKIPNNIEETVSNFWQCPSCEKIYWEGTHIVKLQNFVRNVNES